MPLSTAARLEIQRDLIEESRLNPLEWIERYAKGFDEMTTSSKKLQDLWKRDPEAAEDIIRRHLEANFPEHIVRRPPMR